MDFPMVFPIRIMMRTPFALIAVLACALAFSTACQGDEMKIDRSPLPATASSIHLWAYSAEGCGADDRGA